MKEKCSEAKAKYMNAFEFIHMYVTLKFIEAVCQLPLHQGIRLKSSIHAYTTHSLSMNIRPSKMRLLK
jgi:hypothetical protein